jgi:circadian clock protein KaiB
MGLSTAEAANPDDDGRRYDLCLYVTGASANSVRAVTNIKHICETYLAGRYVLEVVDVYQQKHVAQQEQLVALPLLIKRWPLPERRLIGNMSNIENVLHGLGLTNEPT